MFKNPIFFCATDKEIYDVLMSSKRQLSESDLLELARDRGIFYSPKDSRETLASCLSLLPHDYHDLNAILDQCEHSGRAEKITSIILNSKIDIDDIKEISGEYRENAPSDEKVISNQQGDNKYSLSIEYSEIDFSKTRLKQRRRKEAEIEFIIDGNKTIVRMPANEKGKEIVDNLKKKIDIKKQVEIPVDLIELADFNNQSRTEFFTSLIRNMPDFKLENVTSVKVESSIKKDLDEELELEDDQEIEEAEHEMLNLVKNVALKGNSLLSSSEYQQLKKKGFYITNIIWRSKKNNPPSIIEFEAGFEDPEDLKNFKYNIRGAYHFHKGNYTKTLRPVSSEEKQQYLALIEQTAHKTLAELREKMDEKNATIPINGENP